MKSLLLAILLLPLTLFAQKRGQALIDSLKNALPNAKEDTNKVMVLYNIAFPYKAINPDEGLKYAGQTLELATKLNWKMGIARAHNALGVNYLGKSDFQNALKHYGAALNLFRSAGYQKGVATVMGNMANVYVNLSDYAKAEEYDTAAINELGALGDKAGVARVTGNLGNVYKSESNITRALECYNKALAMHRAQADTPAIARVLGNMGDAYFHESNYALALEYERKALAMHEAQGNKLFAANAISDIGLIYTDMGSYPQALDNDLKALKLYGALGNKNGEGRASVNISNVYALQGEYDNSLGYAVTALKIFEKTGDKEGIAAANGNIGNVYMQRNDYPAASRYFAKQLEMDLAIGDKANAVQANLNMAYIYIRQKKFRDAVISSANALSMAKEIGRRHQVAEAWYQLGDAYLCWVQYRGAVAGQSNAAHTATAYKIAQGKAAQLHESIASLENGLSVAKEINSPDVMQECYEDLAKAYKLNGNFPAALAAYQDFVAVRDSIFSKENEKKLLRTEMQFAYDKQRYADSLKNATARREASVQLQHQRNYTYIGIAGSLMLLAFLFFMSWNMKLLHREKQRSEDLLLNILPEEVATELKDKGSAGTKYFDHVTVLFTDFVNFTRAGETMTPQVLIQELDTCFKAFDEITARYNVEKIKTIGDAYLAVAGLPVADEKHAEQIVHAALAIHEFMEARFAALGDKTFQIRIGIHSGSVVAGIVGVKKFAYDIWGDTVNIAARMEQSSQAGKINISQATYDLVKDKFHCTFRGELEAKNKGRMGMYFVESERVS